MPNVVSLGRGFRSTGSRRPPLPAQLHSGNRVRRREAAAGPAPRPVRGAAPYQSSTFRPGTRRNSVVLCVTSVSLRAAVLVTLDPDQTVFGMSFNTTVPASDFVFSTQESGWTYRGVSRAEGIGTDGFDHTLYRSDYGVGNTFSFRVVGAAIATDAGFWESNLAGCHACENTWAWYTIMHGSHFGVWAADARWYTRPVPLLAPTDPISMRR